MKRIKELTNQLLSFDSNVLYTISLEAYKNASNLLEESLVLIGNGSYSRSFLLSYSSLEELGKAYHTALLAGMKLINAPKDEIEGFSEYVAKLYDSHKEKINAVSLSVLVQDFLSELEFPKEFSDISMEDLDQLGEAEIKSFAEELTIIISPFENWLEKELDEDEKNENFISINDRNRSLYVDFKLDNEFPLILTPEQIPRHIPISFAATSSKYIDAFNSYFLLIEEILNDNDKVKTLFIELLKNIRSKNS